MDKRTKELAEQAGIEYSSQWTYWTAYDLELQRFAEIIRLDETKACAKHYLEIMRDAIASAVLKEREVCAALCDAECNKEDPMKIIGTYESGCYLTAEFLANEIRSRK